MNNYTKNNNYERPFLLHDSLASMVLSWGCDDGPIGGVPSSLLTTSGQSSGATDGDSFAGRADHPNVRVCAD